MAHPPFPLTRRWRTLAGGVTSRHSSALTVSERVVHLAGAGQWHYPTEAAFGEANNAVAVGGVDAISPLLRSSIDRWRHQLWRDHDGTGGLYLLLLSIRNDAGTTATLWLDLYESPSGEGESAPGVPDWTLVTTIIDYTGNDGDSVGGSMFPYDPVPLVIAQPVRTDGGRIILAVASPFGGSFQNGTSKMSIWTSESDPAGPWTHRFRSGVGGRNTGFGPRQVVPWNGLWYVGQGGDPGQWSQIASANDGLNWTDGLRGVRGTNYDLLHSADGILYRLLAGFDVPGEFEGYLQTTTGDPFDGPWTTILQVSDGSHFVGFEFVGQEFVTLRGRQNPGWFVDLNAVLVDEGGGWKINMI